MRGGVKVVKSERTFDRKAERVRLGGGHPEWIRLLLASDVV